MDAAETLLGDAGSGEAISMMGERAEAREGKARVRLELMRALVEAGAHGAMSASSNSTVSPAPLASPPDDGAFCLEARY